MSSLIFRVASLTDVEKIVELRLLLQQHAERSNPSIWRLTGGGEKLLKQKVENDFMDSTVRVVVAELDGGIVGFIRGETVQRDDYVPKSVGSISLIYVTERFRRKGIGTCLVRKLCEFFSLTKVEHVTLRYIIGNKEAEQFWKKIGFEPLIITAGMQLRELESGLKKSDLSDM